MNSLARKQSVFFVKFSRIFRYHIIVSLLAVAVAGCASKSWVTENYCDKTSLNSRLDDLDTKISLLDRDINEAIFKKLRDYYMKSEIDRKFSDLRSDISDQNKQLKSGLERLEISLRERLSQLRGYLDRLAEISSKQTVTLRAHVALLDAALKDKDYELNPAGVFILEVNEAENTVTVNRGADWGLKQGMEMEVIDRIDGEKDGEIEIISVESNRSIGSITGRVEDSTRTINWGDEIKKK